MAGPHPAESPRPPGQTASCSTASIRRPPRPGKGRPGRTGRRSAPARRNLRGTWSFTRGGYGLVGRIGQAAEDLEIGDQRIHFGELVGDAVEGPNCRGVTITFADAFRL